MTGPQGDYVATLDCRSLITGEPHRLTFRSAPPVLGEQLWCYACQTYSRVIDAPYIVQARCRSCTYASHPSPRATPALAAAGRHADNYPAHRVVVRRADAVIRVWEPRDDSLKNSFEKLCDSLLTGRAT